MLKIQSQPNGIGENLSQSKKPLSKASEITLQVRERILREYSQNPGLLSYFA